MVRDEGGNPRMEGEEDLDESVIRPERFSEFVGQDLVKETLKIAIDAAKARGEPLDHTLFSGPPGLGKTTLAHIIAREMGTNLHCTSGPVLEKPGDLAAILTLLKKGDVLFIDEIHRLHTVIEEILYPAMEDFCIDVMIGEGPSARSSRSRSSFHSHRGDDAGRPSRFALPGQVRTRRQVESLQYRGAGKDRHAECGNHEDPNST